MKRLHVLFCVGLLLVAVGAQAAKVKVEYKDAAYFQGLKKYAWAREPLVKTGRTVGPDLAGLDRVVRAAVDRELAAKGFEKVPVDEAEVTVDYSVGTAGVVDSKATGESGVPGSSMGEGSYVRAYSEGMLSVVFLDPAANRMMWRGWASAVLSNPDKLRPQVDKAVRKLMKRFPPKR